MFWSPDLGESAPPLLVGYTCEGLRSTWKLLFLPGGPPPVGDTTFDLPFDEASRVHRDFAFELPPSGESSALHLGYSLDFELTDADGSAAIVVTGTKTESSAEGSAVLPPREFGSDAPLPVFPISLEESLADHPEYQHPFRQQAALECGPDSS